jgi:CRISPR/Cas system-associated endoribonuclease Cas2
MTLYIITYDVRSKSHNYQPLYDRLNEWGAAHLQNSVWLASLNGGPAEVREALMALLHRDDTVCVIQLTTGLGWSTQNARSTGTNWLMANVMRYAA